MELLGRLGRRLALEGAARDLPERQRTLRATIDWSHQLLDTEEARLFAYLSVFAGGWTRQAAERVCGEGLRVQVLDGLESLVEHSLVQRATLGGDELRFDMLETIREYAGSGWTRPVRPLTSPAATPITSSTWPRTPSLI